MYSGSWDITSRRVVKTLRWAVAAAAPMLRVAPHHKWMETSIRFDASDCPKNMAGAGQLRLVISLTIANIRLYHVLIDGRAALNLISLATFQKLQIPMSRLSPSCLFLGVGLGSIIPRDSISLPVTFGTPENYRTKSVIFDVVDVNLSFNATIGRTTLYQFMAVTHYEYLIMKMSSPNGIIKIRGYRSTDVSVLEKLKALAAAQEVAFGYRASNQAPLSLCQCISSSAPHVQPSYSEDVPVTIIQIGADAAQTTRIAGNLGNK
jgi:hypothetical protein